jgi:hypothetical protein
MSSAETKKIARRAGFLYLASSIPGVFALMYVPGKIFVRGDPAATAERLRTSSSLVRLGVGAELVGMTLFVFVALVLYRLFKPVSPEPALWMMVLILLATPISFVGVLSEVASLNLAGGAGGPDTMAVLGQPQRDALAYLAYRMHGQAILAAEIFWGLWLLPFGLCVIRSGFIPRFLGVLLMIACWGYIGDSLAGLVFPQYAQAVGKVTSLLTPLELPIIFWLLIWGARPSPSLATKSAP